MRDLSEIKALRKKLNITQADLAKESGVSQSLIAKIESGRTEPTFGNAKKILESLDKLSLKSEPTAQDLMTKRIFSCKTDDSIKSVIKKMKQYEISQLPVMDNSVIVGAISESTLLDHVFDNLEQLTVKNIMSTAPPTVDKATPESAILPLLKHFQLVAVLDKGKLIGIITKSDLIMSAYS